MKSEEELRSLLEFLEKIASETDHIRDSYEVCIDCRETEDGTLDWDRRHSSHTSVHHCFEHAGVDEWLRCLRWVLEVKEDRDKQAKHRFRL